MQKRATSIGSAPPDPVKSNAAAMPMPIPVLENKTAPGQTGPRGLSPRTTYSRVNAAPPPTTSLPDGMKASPARGAEFLPAKTAHAEEPTMKMAHRPTLQDMMKAAMEGTIERVDINAEAARQLAGHRGESPEKVASAQAQPDHYSTEHIMKMASALDFIVENLKVADDGNVQMPGKGPGSLDVQEAKSEGSLLEAGQSGQAISADRPPEDPPQQKEEVQVGNAGTGMQTNDDMSHGEQPTSPIKNQNTSIAPMNPLPNPTESTKSAEVLFRENLARLGIKQAAAKKPAAPAPKAKAPAPKGGGKAPIAKLRKMAEDSMNPAKIEAGPENPPDATASGQGVPRQPSDVRGQVNSMISSNQAAIDYTKGEAKADPKSDVNQVLEQPALTRSGDTVLHKVLDNTSQAGVKISSAQKPGTQMAGDTVKVAAARALLSNLMDKVAAEKGGKKKKESTMGGAPNSPSAASGFTASSLG